MGYVIMYIMSPYLYQILLLAIILIILKFILKFFKKRKQIKSIDYTTYYRDIPCFNDINVAYWLLYKYSNLNEKELNNGLIGAYLLKWYKNGDIDIKQSKGLSSNYSIDLKEGNWAQNYAEKLIYKFLKNVAGNNNLLEKNEIRDYCLVDGNKYELNRLFENILQKTQEELEEKKYITVNSDKNLFKTKENITLSKEILNEYQNLNGLKNFLRDYSNIEQKKNIEVSIWEEYLIYANLLGIANEVKKQFKKIYPNFNARDAIFDISTDSIIEIVYKRITKLFINLCIMVAIIIIIMIIGLSGKR